MIRKYLRSTGAEALIKMKLMFMQFILNEKNA